MPFCEADPWRLQYFAGVACPEDVRIPTEDADAWLWNPAYRWVYDKLRVAGSQGLACAPHGVRPPAFPVFSKPIINLHGMGVGSRVLPDLATYEREETAGHFWMPLLAGDHVSTDVAVVCGQARWFRHCRGVPGVGGTFDYWTIEAGRRESLAAYLEAWVVAQLFGHTGVVKPRDDAGRL